MFKLGIVVSNLGASKVLWVIDDVFIFIFWVMNRILALLDNSPGFFGGQRGKAWDQVMVGIVAVVVEGN